MAARKISMLKRVFNTVKGFLGGMLGMDDPQMRHEREMAELDAFTQGKVTPGYLLRYAAIILFCVLGILIIVDVTWPDLFPGSPLDAVDHVFHLGADFIRAIFGM